MRLYIYLFLTVLGSSSSFSQNASIKTFENYLSIEKEEVYVFLNKTVFTPSETLWFTGFVKNRASKVAEIPSSNLKVSIFSQEGTFIEQHQFLIEDQVAQGSFLLKFPPGIYYVKAQTNRMRNFKDLRPFVQKIEIINYGRSSYLSQKDWENNSNKILKSDDSLLFQIDMKPPSRAIVTINLSENYKSSLGKKRRNWKLGFHNNQSAQVSKVNLTDTMTVVSIDKSKLYAGVNTFFLIDGNENMLRERMVYNYSDSDPAVKNVTILSQVFEEDSLSLEIQMPLSGMSPKHISALIIPKQSEAAYFTPSIVAQETFKYVDVESGLLSMPKNRIDSYEINSKLSSLKNTLDWTLITPESIVPGYDTHRGFNVKGTIKNWNTGTEADLSFYQSEVGIIRDTKIGRNGEFHFKNCYIEKNKDLLFSVINTKKKFLEPEIVYDITPKVQKDTLALYYYEEKDLDLPVSLIDIAVEDPSITTQDGNLLNEVEITGKGRGDEAFERNEKLAKNGFYDKKKITEEDENKIATLARLFRKIGYNVSPFLDALRIPNGKLLVETRSINDNNPYVIIDGIFAFNGVPDLPLSLVDEIYYGGAGATFGNRSSVIIIYTKASKRKNTITSVDAQIGFEKPVPFTSDFIEGTFDEFSKNYGKLFWDGDLEIDSKGRSFIKIPTYGVKELKIILQGMDSDGSLFSYATDATVD